MARLRTSGWWTSLTVCFALTAGAPGGWSTPERAWAQEPATPIVFVFDGSGARVSGERVRRVLATALQQSVIRITDEAASGPHTTLTVAFEAPDRWVFDIARGETHVVRHVRLRTPSVGSLARVALALIRDTEIVAPHPQTVVRRRDDDWLATIRDEIIDPFGGVGPIHHGRVILDELVDPFGGGATTISSGRRRDGVVDPWDN